MEDDALPLMLFSMLADECSVQSAGPVCAELVAGASMMEETFVSLSGCQVPRKLTKVIYGLLCVPSSRYKTHRW